LLLLLLLLPLPLVLLPLLLLLLLLPLLLLLLLLALPDPVVEQVRGGVRAGRRREAAEQRHLAREQRQGRGSLGTVVVVVTAAL